MEFFTVYYDQALLDSLLSLMACFPVGILLASSAWMVSILVHTCFRWLKG